MTYQNEHVARVAPRWAWEVIDELLSTATDSHIVEALSAMIAACEGEEEIAL